MASDKANKIIILIITAFCMNTYPPGYNGLSSFVGISSFCERERYTCHINEIKRKVIIFLFYILAKCIWTNTDFSAFICSCICAFI